MGAEQLTRIVFNVIAILATAVVVLLYVRKKDRTSTVGSALVFAALATGIIPVIVELQSGLSAALSYLGWVLLVAALGVFWWTSRSQRRSRMQVTAL